jgi:hypothetical protein
MVMTYIGLNRGRGQFLNLLGAPMILYGKKCTGIYNCALIKVDWLVAFIEVRVVGTVPVFVIFLQRWRTIFTVYSQWEVRADI